MNQEDQDDRETIKKVQKGDTEAFEGLVIRHQARVFNLLYRWTGDYEEAAELAQDVFLSAFRSIKQFRGESRFSTWLFRIAANHAKNRLQRLNLTRRRHVALDDGNPGGDKTELSDGFPDPAQVLEKKEIDRLVQKEILSLKEEDSILILLHDFQDVSYEEIGAILDLPVGTVKSRLHRARRALKARLTPHFSSMRHHHEL